MPNKCAHYKAPVTSTMCCGFSLIYIYICIYIYIFISVFIFIFFWFYIIKHFIVWVTGSPIPILLALDLAKCFFKLGGILIGGHG